MNEKKVMVFNADGCVLTILTIKYEESKGVDIRKCVESFFFHKGLISSDCDWKEISEIKDEVMYNMKDSDYYLEGRI